MIDEEELQKVQDDEQRVEGIEVDIKGVAPLHIIVLTRVLHQVLIGDHPHQGGNEEPHADAVDEHDPQKQLQSLHKAHVQNQSETHRGHTKPDAEKDQECWVVTCPLVFSLLAVVEVAVHPLWRGEQVEHLPHGELKVHLPEVKKPPQVLVALGSCRVPRSISGAEAPVTMALRGVGGGRQHIAARPVGPPTAVLITLAPLLQASSVPN